MNRFVLKIFVSMATFVLGYGQLGFAQIQILDGDGIQVTPNEIPAEKQDRPGTESIPESSIPEMVPQIFDGNGSSIIIRKSFSSIDENGNQRTESSGKAIVIGPDGKRQEFDLKDGENSPMNLGGLRIDGLTPPPAANGQAKSFSLGFQCQPIDPALASQLNLETGLMVSRVLTESPASMAGVQQYDVLLFADEKQLTNKAILSESVQSAGEADAKISLTLMRGGKEMSVVVKPEKQFAGRMNMDQLNSIPQIDLPGFENDDLFFEDALGNGMEARMRHQMEKMEERVLQMQRQLGNGLIEIPQPFKQDRE